MLLKLLHSFVKKLLCIRTYTYAWKKFENSNVRFNPNKLRARKQGWKTFIRS